MTIVCLEGASAIGKTTSSNFMVEEYGYVRIPEINELFERPENELSDWYLNMQVSRWELAKEISESGKVAILDGDHLQPIWYNWILEDIGLQPVSEVLAFYSKAFFNGSLGFPDVYVILSLGVDDLRLRKERDTTRSRRNFETHLRLIEPQREYFESLKARGLEAVQFFESSSPEEVANLCWSICHNLKDSKHKVGFEVVDKFMTSKLAYSRF